MLQAVGFGLGQLEWRIENIDEQAFGKAVAPDDVAGVGLAQSGECDALLPGDLKQSFLSHPLNHARKRRRAWCQPPRPSGYAASRRQAHSYAGLVRLPARWPRKGGSSPRFGTCAAGREVESPWAHCRMERPGSVSRCSRPRNGCRHTTSASPRCRSVALPAVPKRAGVSLRMCLQASHPRRLRDVAAP